VLSDEAPLQPKAPAEAGAVRSLKLEESA
jgi:hypothetical protein